jgi:molybdopterin-guanine dinucleotide biosynthesis protein A
MLSHISGAILCGGLNTRMNGQAKCNIRLGRQTFLQRLAKTLGSVCTEVSIIARHAEDYCSVSLPVHTDIFSLRCSLTGLHTALSHSRHHYVFITACDTPLLVPDLIRLLMDQASPGDDVVVPVINGYFEPLCALYSCNCLPVATKLLQNGQPKISAMYSQVRVHTVPDAVIRTLDPKLDSFINVNTPEDLGRLFQKTANRRTNHKP